jgi:predicted acylesterase/phospholipase RssA
MSRGCIRVAIVFGALLLSGGCASTPNKPLNQPAKATQPDNPVQPAVTFSNNPAPIPPQNRLSNDRSDLRAHAELAYDTDLVDDPIFIGLTFSGGGTRAAAFGYGVIKEFEATQIQVSGDRPPSLFDHIDILSGVSGGSVLAAYIGLKGRAGLDDFRERFLLRDAEGSINTSMGLNTLGAAISDGINDQTKLPRWLDDNLFHGATMRDLERERPKHIHIYASDLYNRHPFVFSRATFDAICSDYESYPLSTAVAASAAVPFVFSPIVLRTFPDHCQTTLPAWIDRAINNREESQLLRSAAQGLRRNRDPDQVRYVKLVDGGLSDNFGVTGFVVERAKHQTPYSPLSPEHAVKFRRAFVGEIAFDQLGPERLKALNAVPTRFKLPQDQVDMLIAAGRDALRENDVFRRFLASIANNGHVAPRVRSHTACAIAHPPVDQRSSPGVGEEGRTRDRRARCTGDADPGSAQRVRPRPRFSRSEYSERLPVRKALAPAIEGWVTGDNLPKKA